MAWIQAQVKDLECVFLTYDEPGADLQWERLQGLFQKVHRVHGVKGIDKAHKACADIACSERILIVDGDNTINKNFLRQLVEYDDEKHNEVLSWSALNNVNGLMYGNGGPKLWPRQLLKNIKSHESAESPEWQVDFCFGVEYRPMPFCASYLWISGSPQQAFRAGFREGIKFCLNNGETPFQASDLIQKMPKGNLARLLIWCSVGRDVENGIWSMLGARLAIKFLLTGVIEPERINDYDWFRGIWNEDELISLTNKDGTPCPKKADIKTRELGTWLYEHIGLNILELEGKELGFFRQIHVNPSRTPHLEY
jgi:hypothetical protein